MSDPNKTKWPWRKLTFRDVNKSVLSAFFLEILRPITVEITNVYILKQFFFEISVTEKQGIIVA